MRFLPRVDSCQFSVHLLWKTESNIQLRTQILVTLSCSIYSQMSCFVGWTPRTCEWHSVDYHVKQSGSQSGHELLTDFSLLCLVFQYLKAILTPTAKVWANFGGKISSKSSPNTRSDNSSFCFSVAKTFCVEATFDCFCKISGLQSQDLLFLMGGVWSAVLVTLLCSTHNVNWMIQSVIYVFLIIIDYCVKSFWGKVTKWKVLILVAAIQLHKRRMGVDTQRLFPQISFERRCPDRSGWMEKSSSSHWVYQAQPVSIISNVLCVLLMLR